MAPLTHRSPRFAEPLPFAARLGAGVLLAATLLVFGTAHAQMPAPIVGDVTYVKFATFTIPFSTDPNDRRLAKVHLYVSEDRGKTYNKVATALPGEKGFRFTALRDGLYWFSTQTEDVDARFNPPNVGPLPPGLQVIVDTQKPIVTLKPAAARDGMVAFEWDIRDENLDPLSIRADYRPVGGGTWYPLPVDRKAFGTYEWNPGGNGPFEVRLQVSDLAKNATEQTTTIGGGARPAPGPNSGTGAGIGAAPAVPRSNLIWVNKRKFNLNFKLEEVGQSGVVHIEVYRCSATMLDWQLMGTAPLKPENINVNQPIELTVDKEGRYGYTLIPRSGVGLSALKPDRGEQPQVWVEVDETPPTVRVEKVEVGRGADQGNITIYWTAQDNRQLIDNPITISYSDKPDGSWTVIGAAHLPNARSYIWHMDEKVPYQFYIKVEAVDMAGNVGRDIQQQPVKVDLKIPRAVILGIEPSSGGTSGTPVRP
jgi:hypothetical protein